MNPKFKNFIFYSKTIRSAYQKVSFIFKLGYFPNLKNPISYNEKINYRKNNITNDLFTICSDKIRAKDYVKNILGDDVIIENYYEGNSIDIHIIKKIINDKGDIVLKTNHNSGSVYILNRNSTDKEILDACTDIIKQLKIDFGKLTGETWYSKIKPKVLIEKRLFNTNNDEDIQDYKFHVFKQKNKKPKVFFHIDFDRSKNHNRSYFDAELNWLPFSVFAPSIKTQIQKPLNFEKMKEMAILLAEPFSYVRVDFYNIDGKIYFGELTFAPGSGLSAFSNKKYDFWFGRHWDISFEI